jgi:protein-disulfide isomerase
MRHRQHRQQQLRIALITLTLAVLLGGGAWFAVQRFANDPASTATDPYDGVSIAGTVFGSPDAPIRLVEYGDFYCPHCADFALETEPALIRDYVRTGKIAYEFLPMPVLGGDLTDPANPSVRLAEAAFAALAQDAYWPFHHAAFEATAAQSGTPLTDDDILAIAADTVPDPDRFRTEFESGRYRQQVLDTYNQGMALGISSVPSFFVDGQLIPWTGDEATFFAALDRLIA